MQGNGLPPWYRPVTAGLVLWAVLAWPYLGLPYNEHRPHDSLGDLTPVEYRKHVAKSSIFEVSTYRGSLRNWSETGGSLHSFADQNIGFDDGTQ